MPTPSQAKCYNPRHPERTLRYQTVAEHHTPVSSNCKGCWPGGQTCALARWAVSCSDLTMNCTKARNSGGMGRTGRVPGTRELVLHHNYIAICRVRGDNVEILRLHHAAQNL